MQEHQDFKSRVLGSFRKSPFKIQNDRDGLQEQIDSVLDSDSLRAQASLALGEGDEAFSELSEKRQHGIHKIGNKVQEFTVNFAGFVRVYGGFIDVIRQGGGIYADVAYGTLSIFLMVSSMVLPPMTSDLYCRSPSASPRRT